MTWQWMALDAEDEWTSRLAKLAWMNTWPQPCYVLSGPGFHSDERLVFISDEPWTDKAVQAALAEIYGFGDDEPQDSDPAYTAWVRQWMNHLPD